MKGSLVIVPLLFVVTAEAAEAACAGASPTWTTTPDYVAVSQCVANAARGDTVMVEAGSATWSAPLDLTRGVTLLGAGREQLTITSTAGTVLAIEPDATAIDQEELIQVSGFTFEGGGTVNGFVRIIGATATSARPFRNLAITDNRFQNPAQTNSSMVYQTGQVRGVIANNIFDRPMILARCFGNDDQAEFSNDAYIPFVRGSEDSLYYEDNTIQWSTAGGATGFAGWIECGQGGRVVFRYNSWDFANASGQDETWDVHGFQNWSAGSPGQTGTMSVEYYGNTMSDRAGYRNLFHRGGQGIYFNNLISGVSGAAANVANQDGGCHDDIDVTWPPPFVQTSEVYYWNNTDNGSPTTLTVYPPGDGYNMDCPPIENVHFWNLDAACTASACSAGIGRGTSAPTGTCAPGTGYWVASDPLPTADPQVIQAGRLYRCTAPDVWSSGYVPYTYPHPLRGGAPPPPGAPAAPTGLAVSASG